MEQPRRLHPLLAGVCAAFAGSFLGGLFLTLAGFSGKPSSIGEILLGTIFVGGYGALIALPVVIVYGMPLFAGLSRLHFANFATAAFFGALPGVLWILWTHESWVDPILWNGTLIALIYVYLRRLRAAV